jgi:hypothetical protein
LRNSQNSYEDVLGMMLLLPLLKYPGVPWIGKACEDGEFPFPFTGGKGPMNGNGNSGLLVCESYNPHGKSSSL